jgi:hypothetical protein
MPLNARLTGYRCFINASERGQIYEERYFLGHWADRPDLDKYIFNHYGIPGNSMASLDKERLFQLTSHLERDMIPDHLRDLIPEHLSKDFPRTHRGDDFRIFVDALAWIVTPDPKAVRFVYYQSREDWDIEKLP